MAPNNTFQAQLEQRFLLSLRRHLTGLRAKVLSDFSQGAYEHELSKLQRDPVYPKFGFDTAEYVLIRLMGRISISIGRRLGEIYDKIPRFVAAARFDLLPEQVAFKLNGLELDIGLRYKFLEQPDIDHVNTVISRYLPDEPNINALRNECDAGVGIEIRYNFNPNDSARLRKDETMSNYLQAQNLFPIYLVFSAISPRDEAIARLRRAGWSFLIGETAISFARELLGLDLAEILDRPTIKDEIQQEVSQTMRQMVESYAFQQVLSKYVN